MSDEPKWARAIDINDPVTVQDLARHHRDKTGHRFTAGIDGHYAPCGECGWVAEKHEPFGLITVEREAESE